MPTEDDLRTLFAGAEAPQHVDVQHVIARSRARRLPRKWAVWAISTLAVAGIVAVSLPALLPQASTSTLSGAAAPNAESNQTFDTKRAPAEKINQCTAAVTQAAPSPYGLQLDVAFPATATVGTDPIQGTVRLTNSSQQTVIGTTAAAPTITLSQGGVVLWHSNGPTIERVVTVDLAPGQSMEYPASFTPVRCDVQDDEAESFRAELPALSAGSYDLSAAIDFLPDASMVQLATPGVDLVTGPLAAITLN